MERTIKTKPLLDDLKGIRETLVGAGDPILASMMNRAIACVEKQPSVDTWIPVTEAMPDNFVSVLGYMTDAGDFPPVRECYTVGNSFFFPALADVHPVSHWKPMPEPPKGV